MKRRDFLKASAAIPAFTALNTVSMQGAEPGPSAARDFYELRTYRLRDPSRQRLLDEYLETAAIPALNRLGIKPVGVFTEQEPKDGPAVHMLIPYTSVDAFGKATQTLNHDDAHQAAAAYLGVPKSNPAFERIDSWLLLAFLGMPRLERPSVPGGGRPRLFEIRVYESHSESKAAKKVDMFNAGEIDVMREVGLGPVFFGAGLIGGNLPHLTYMLSGEDMDSHKEHWQAFKKHPVWEKLKTDPQYKDTVSKITNRFLVPTSYSQI